MKALVFTLFLVELVIIGYSAYLTKRIGKFEDLTRENISRLTDAIKEDRKRLAEHGVAIKDIIGSINLLGEKIKRLNDSSIDESAKYDLDKSIDNLKKLI